jgi:4-aminobutyrate aminotransferase
MSTHGPILFCHFRLINVILTNNASSTELFAALHELQNDSALAPHILDVRGQGLMVSIEFASPSGPGTQYDPAANADSPKALAGRVAKRCIEKGLLILTTSAYEVVRFIPPLNITKEDLAKGTGLFAEVVREVVKEG